MFSPYANYYYIVIGLQAICAIYCFRKGNQNKWIWLIIFLPLIGSLIYIFTEIFTRSDIQQVQAGVGTVFNPSGKIKTLQENLRFADTFNNRMALADAYLAAGQVDKAIELYESSMTGTFVNNEQANMQLIVAYFEKKRFDDLIASAEKIYHLPQFTRSRPHMLYAIALGYTGNTAAAEKEFAMMKGRFSNYESRYHYGMLLKRTRQNDAARTIFAEMVDEASHLSSNEKRNTRIWLNNAKEELKTIGTANA